MLVITLFTLAYACLIIAAACGIGKALKQHTESAYPFTEPPVPLSYDGPTETDGAQAHGLLSNTADAHP